MANLLASHPPQDGREYAAQCARCGSSVTFYDCSECGGEGFTDHDCGDDTCCCLEPLDDVCFVCSGTGTFGACLASFDWCAENPLPGREGKVRWQIEWFLVEQREASC